VWTSQRLDGGAILNLGPCTKEARDFRMTVRENEKTVRKGERTRQAILNAAEAEFALSGYEAVSIRQVADAAAQHLGVVTYHYPNKELLFEAVIARRAEELTQRRKERLSDLADPTIESLLDAFLDPFREKVEGGSDGWRRYAQILAHIAQDARWAPLVDRLFGETGRKFISLMREVEPRLTLDTATQGYVHLISVWWDCSRRPSYWTACPTERCRAIVFRKIMIRPSRSLPVACALSPRKCPLRPMPRHFQERQASDFCLRMSHQLEPDDFHEATAVCRDLEI